MMHEAIIRAAREVRADWLREAEGSRRQQEGYQEIADQHGRDADRAEAAAAQLAAALITEGIEP